MKPSVHIGKGGISDAVVAEIERAAAAAELVKIKVLPGAPLSPDEAMAALDEKTEGRFVGRTGRVLVYFLAIQEARE